MKERTRRSYIRKPNERREEILKGAMELFTRYGYEATSMRDIARYLKISLGLCYRYFDNKQILFEEAMDQYAKECCTHFMKALKDHEVDALGEISMLFSQIEKEDQVAPYHDFFHRPENTYLHEELGLRICKLMYEPIYQEMVRYEQRKQIQIRNKEFLIKFMTYGQIGLLGNHTIEKEMLDSVVNYIEILIEKETIPA